MYQQKNDNFRHKLKIFAVMLTVGMLIVIAGICAFFIVEINDTVYASGVVEARFIYDVVGHIEGRITKLNFRTGDKVKKGDIIAYIDPAPYETAAVTAQTEIDELNAELNAKKAKHAQLKRDPLPKELWHVEATLKECADKEKTAREKLDRYIKLEQTHAVSKNELETVRVAHIEAIADLERAKANALRVKSGYAEGILEQSKKEIELVESKIRGRRAMLKLAEKRIEDCKIIAPDSGTLVSIECMKTYYIEQGKPVCSIAADGEIVLLCNVDQRYIRKIKVGQPVKIASEIYNRIKFGRFDGTVEKIGDITYDIGGVMKYPVKIRFSPGKFNVKYGSKAEAAIYTGRRTAFLALTNLGDDEI